MHVQSLFQRALDLNRWKADICPHVISFKGERGEGEEGSTIEAITQQSRRKGSEGVSAEWRPPSLPRLSFGNALSGRVFTLVS